MGAVLPLGAVLPWLLPWLLPLGTKNSSQVQGGRHRCNFLVPLASSSIATLSSSTATPSSSTVRSSGTTAPMVLLAFLPPRCCVSKGYYRPSGSTVRSSGSTMRTSGSTAPAVLLAFCLIAVVFQRGTSARDQKLVTSPAVVGTDVIF